MLRTSFCDAFSKEDCRAIVLPSKTGMIGKRQLDLWEANRRILLEAGVPEKIFPSLISAQMQSG